MNVFFLGHTGHIEEEIFYVLARPNIALRVLNPAQNTCSVEIDLSRPPAI